MYVESYYQYFHLLCYVRCLLAWLCVTQNQLPPLCVVEGRPYACLLNYSYETELLIFEILNYALVPPD